MGKYNLNEIIKERKWIYLPILSLIIGELLIFDGKVLPALYIHLANLIITTLLMIFGYMKLEIKYVLQALTLVLILRIVNLSMPQFFGGILQYPLIYGMMFFPIFKIIKTQHISFRELGITFKKIYIYLPISIPIGILYAIVEFKIINPISMIKDINLSNLILIAIIMFLFIAVVEEIIFRPILQNRLKNIFGSKIGILLSGLLFGMMHSTYGILNEIIFATMFGIMLGYIFHITKNLLFTISIHGSANIILFGILPLLSSKL